MFFIIIAQNNRIVEKSSLISVIKPRSESLYIISYPGLFLFNRHLSVLRQCKAAGNLNTLY